MTSTADRLFEELCKEHRVHPESASAEVVRYHIRYGRAFGFPDCCIRHYVSERATESFAGTEEQDYAMLVACRRVCDECLARMQTLKEDPQIQEAWTQVTLYRKLRTTARRAKSRKYEDLHEAADALDKFLDAKEKRNVPQKGRITPGDGYE